MYYESTFPRTGTSGRRRTYGGYAPAPVFANGNGGAISGYRPRGTSVAPDYDEQLAPPAARGPQQSVLDPATSLAPPQMDLAIRNQKRLYGVQNEQQYKQDRYARNRLKTEAGERGDAAAKDAYQQALLAPPPRTAAPMVQAPPQFPQPGQPALPAPQPATSLAPPPPPQFGVRDKLTGETRVGSDGLGGTIPADGRTQTITMRADTPGTSYAPSMDAAQIAAAEIQRRQNFTALQGRGIQPPGSAYITPPGYPTQPVAETPAVKGEAVTRTFQRVGEDPRRAEAAKAAAAARSRENATFDIAEDQRRIGNQLAGQSIDAQAGFVQGQIENDATRANAAQTAADARMKEAGRPRQATPGTKPQGATLDQLQRALVDAEDNGREAYAASLRQKIDQMLGVETPPVAPTDGSPAPWNRDQVVPSQGQMVQQWQQSGSPATQPAAPSDADYEATARKYGITVDEVKRRLSQGR